MRKYLGIEFGSTRIKAVIIDEKANVIAQGSYGWENSLVDGLWSYSLDEAWTGLQTSYAELAKNYKAKYNEDLTEVSAIGISAMMHGYLAFDKEGKLLAPFRTWRNSNTAKAAEELSEIFDFNVPLRWSVSQYYQSYLDKLEHVKDIDFLTTLAGYAHYKLTGEKVLGIGDASGMFPVDGKDYDKAMLAKFNKLIGRDFKKLLPKVLLAGENAGTLTKEGALLLDPTGKLKAGAVLCPPEGDMETGMVCTNTVAPKTANMSAGTSVGLVVDLEKPLKHRYKEIDIIATPDGYPAALIHTNNCTSEINEWVSLFGEVAELCGAKIGKGELFEKLFNKSLESDENTGKLIGYNFLAAETLAETKNGLPMIMRKPDGKLNLANFMQMQIYSAISTTVLGLDILKKEAVKIESVTAHGGFYKTKFVGQNATSALLGVPVTVMETAGEGGAWGIALLAAYVQNKNITLSEYLNGIFANAQKSTVMADEKECSKFNSFWNSYEKGLTVARFAAEEM